MSKTSIEKNMIKEYNIVGMDCADCALHVENQVKKIEGISNVRVNFITGEMKLSSNNVDEKQIVKAVKNAGYKIDNKKIKKSVLLVEGMNCQDEVNVIQKRLQMLSEIKEIKFKVINNEIHILHENTVADIRSEIEKLGFKSFLKSGEQSEQDNQKKYYLRQSQLTIISGLSVFTGALVHYLLDLPIVTNILLISGIIIGGYRIGIKGIKEARNFSAGMNILMSIAIIGALFIGEWLEAAMVVFLFALAQLLELRSMEKVRNSVNVLINESPKFANVWRDGKYISRAVEDIQIGQKILVKPGEKIPIDGKVIMGESFVDQSVITGESIPVKISPGDRVFAGSINQNGVVEIEVDRLFSESTISQIVHLVSEAQASKAPQQAFVDKFARYYTPIVIAIAVFVAILPPLIFSLPFTDWFYRALVLLVIACPCALVISTPVTIVSGLTNAMKNGILIKGGVFLENFSKLKSIVFDKTGTLTIGKPKVQKIFSVNGHSEKEIIKIAASIEINSEHPLGHAIVEFATETKAQLQKVDKFTLNKGRGIEAEINGEKIIIGNHRLFGENELCNDQTHEYLAKIENESHTAVLVGSMQEIYGIISISDSLRPEAQKAISLLKEKGIENIGLLTGDNHRTADAVAQKLDIDYQKSELLPEEKVVQIKKLQSEYHEIGMVGDGINDAPALAAASIGIAMGMRGSDIALETADITLLKDDLLKLPYLHSLSSRVIEIIKQNIAIALGLKLIFIVLAIPGLATLWMAVFADMGASLIVIFNGLRALRLR